MLMETMHLLSTPDWLAGPALSTASHPCHGASLSYPPLLLLITGGGGQSLKGLIPGPNNPRHTLPIRGAAPFWTLTCIDTIR
jgi:hypothetical protein